MREQGKKTERAITAKSKQTVHVRPPGATERHAARVIALQRLPIVRTACERGAYTLERTRAPSTQAHKRKTAKTVVAIGNGWPVSPRDKRHGHPRRTLALSSGMPVRFLLLPVSVDFCRHVPPSLLSMPMERPDDVVGRAGVTLPSAAAPTPDAFSSRDAGVGEVDGTFKDGGASAA